MPTDRPALGEELRRLRQHRGVSLNKLSALVHYSKSYLSKVENGIKPATRDLALRCEQALGAEGELVGLCPARAPAAPRTQTTAQAWPVPLQLPARARYFTGRAQEIAQITRVADAAGAAATTALSAISGTAGIGKTALAVEWAHLAADRYPDGQLFVNLRGFDASGAPVAPGEAIRGFLDAFRVPPAQIPVGADAQAALYRSILATRRVLVLVDNARDADHVRPLLPAGPGCAILVTSRDRLTGLVAAEGAHPVVLSLLTDAEAHQLLCARLGRERVADEPSAVVELIGLCARLPLAVNIAAARAALSPALALAGLVEEMRGARRRLSAFGTGDASTDVRAVFSWSYRLLSPAAKRLFRLLGICPGTGFRTPVAASLLGVPPQGARELISELLQAQLLTEQSGDRYALHDLLRAYAGELAGSVDGAEGIDDALRRFLDHRLHSAQHAASLINPRWEPVATVPAPDGAEPEQFADYDSAMAWFEAEHESLIEAAVRAADAGHDSYAWQLPVTLVTFQDRRSHWAQLAAAQSRALAAAQRLGDERGQARARRGLGRAGLRLGQYEEGREHLLHALAHYRRLDDRIGQAHAHHELALIDEQLGRPRQALEHSGRVLELFAAEGHRSGQANTLNTIGWYHAMLGDYDRTLSYCRQALDIFLDLGNEAEEAGTWDSIGYAHQQLGDHTQAVAAYLKAIKLFRQAGDRYYEAGTLVRLGDTRRTAGDLDAAQAAWRQAIDILDDLRHPDAAQVRSTLLAHS